MVNCGVLYFLMAEKEGRVERVLRGYKEFLIRSLASLNKHMPKVRTILFTNINSVDWQGFDSVNYKSECLLETPFAKTVHMDCDTYVCEEFNDVFEMLDEIDFAASFSPWYFGKRHFNIPRSFPELAGGLMVYNSSNVVFDMLKYTKDLITNRGGGSDEPYLRRALYEHKEVKFSVLPWEYNCVALLPGFLFSKAKILHGKIDNIETLEREMATTDPKFFTGESVIHADRVAKRKYEIGTIQKY